MSDHSTISQSTKNSTGEGLGGLVFHILVVALPREGGLVVALPPGLERHRAGLAVRGVGDRALVGLPHQGEGGRQVWVRGHLGIQGSDPQTFGASFTPLKELTNYSKI